MDIKVTDIGRLWSTHFPRRKIDAASRMFCLSIGHAIRNIAQNIPCGGLTQRLRSALKCLRVPEEEFFQFTGKVIQVCVFQIA
jgi:hypothetical protein